MFTPTIVSEAWAMSKHHLHTKTKLNGLDHHTLPLKVTMWSLSDCPVN